MMIDTDIERDFRVRVCQELSVVPAGIDRYRVDTPFMTDDGDHLVVVLKQQQGQWLLTDEGHTFMHLTYDMDEKDLYRGTRQQLISNALATFSVDDKDGELLIPVEGEQFGNALYNFVQAILRINDVSYLSRERVESAFMEDFRAFIAEHVAPDRRAFDWHDQRYDPEAKYPVDCRVNGMPRPLFVFAVPHDNKARDTTITLLQFERWQVPYRSLAVFEDQETIGRKVLARLSDACEKQFSSLAANRDRIATYLQDVLAT